MVLFLNELRHCWRYRSLTICGKPLHMQQGFIDQVCIHRFTPTKMSQLDPKWVNTHQKMTSHQRDIMNYCSLNWLCVMRSRFFFVFFLASIKQRATDVGPSISLWVVSNARFLCILTGTLNVCASEPESAGLSAWDHVSVKWCACVQLPELKVSEVKNYFYSWRNLHDTFPSCISFPAGKWLYLLC